MSNNLPAKWDMPKIRAIELLVAKPGITQTELSEEIGVARVTINRWFKDPQFVEIFYEKYMVSFGSKLPNVLNAMVKEAEAGNVAAGRLVLEHSGKLIKRVEVANNQSPFEKFLKEDQNNVHEIEAEDADFEDVTGQVDKVEIMPQRPVVPEKPKTAAQEKRELTAKQIHLAKRREARKWRLRAEKVGVPPMTKGRKTQLHKIRWHEEIIKREKELNS